MSLQLTMRLIEVVGATVPGSTVRVEVDGPGDVDVASAWVDATGNTLLSVHDDSVEIYRGRVADPLDALPAERRPGYRLWIYSNFHCNLSCDYCCAGSSPSAPKRMIDTTTFRAIIDEAVAAGVAELFVTGGEPFMMLDIGEHLAIAAAALPTTVLTNGMLWRGRRRELLEELPRDGLTLQISLDSATAELHDRHRGEGSFEAAIAGIRLAQKSGFRVRVAATLGADAAGAELDLNRLFDELELSDDARVVRRIARQGAANVGLTVSRESLIPEICLTADGAWWHPVAVTDPSMKVADTWTPLAGVISTVTDEFRAHRLAGDVLASTFPCA